MSISAERKAEVIKTNATKSGDTGSPEVQVAILTRADHQPDRALQVAHVKDNHSRRGPAQARVAASSVARLSPAYRRGALQEPDRKAGHSPLSGTARALAPRVCCEPRFGSPFHRQRHALPLFEPAHTAPGSPHRRHEGHGAGSRDAFAGRGATARESHLAVLLDGVRPFAKTMRENRQCSIPNVLSSTGVAASSPSKPARSRVRLTAQCSPPTARPRCSPPWSPPRPRSPASTSCR